MSDCTKHDVTAVMAGLELVIDKMFFLGLI